MSIFKDKRLSDPLSWNRESSFTGIWERI